MSQLLKSSVFHNLKKQHTWVSGFSRKIKILKICYNWACVSLTQIYGDRIVAAASFKLDLNHEGLHQLSAFRCTYTRGMHCLPPCRLWHLQPPNPWEQAPCAPVSRGRRDAIWQTHQDNTWVKLGREWSGEVWQEKTSKRHLASLSLFPSIPFHSRQMRSHGEFLSTLNFEGLSVWTSEKRKVAILLSLNPAHCTQLETQGRNPSKEKMSRHWEHGLRHLFES